MKGAAGCGLGPGQRQAFVLTWGYLDLPAAPRRARLEHSPDTRGFPIEPDAQR